MGLRDAVRAGRSKTEHRGGQSSCRKRDHKGQTDFTHEHDGGVSADGEKAGVSEGDLPCVAHENVEADGNDDVDGHVVGHIDIIVLKRKGKRARKAMRMTNQKRVTPELKNWTSS